MPVIFSRLITLLLAAVFLWGPGLALGQEQASPSLLRRLCASFQKEGPRPVLWMDLQVPTLSYEGGMLQVVLSRPLVVEEGPQGLLQLFQSEPLTAAATLPIAEGARLIRSQSGGRLQTRLLFQAEPGPLMGTPCLLLGGGHVTRVRIVPLTVILYEGGREQARLHTEQGAALAQVQRASRPDVQADVQLNPKDLVFDGEDEDLGPLGQALSPLPKRALACYRRALLNRPGLAGRFIIGVQIDQAGHLSEARVEVDAIGDRALARCVLDLLPTLRPPRLHRAGHVSIPLALRLE